jgi:hypothetical protein
VKESFSVALRLFLTITPKMAHYKFGGGNDGEGLPGSATYTAFQPIRFNELFHAIQDMIGDKGKIGNGIIPV